MMVVVVSKRPLDWYSINKAISQQPQTDYATRVNHTFRKDNSPEIHYESTNTGTIKFSGAAADDQVAACVVEISKQP